MSKPLRGPNDQPRPLFLPVGTEQDERPEPVHVEPEPTPAPPPVEEAEPTEVTEDV